MLQGGERKEHEERRVRKTGMERGKVKGRGNGGNGMAYCF